MRNILVLVALCLSTFNVHAQMVSYGTDNACDYQIANKTIQNLIDENNAEIRIVTGTYVENIHINNKNVKLLGGYANCADANDDIYDSDSLATTIRPANGSGAPAIRISAGATRRSVTLRNLSAKNGEPSGADSGGGISIVNANLKLTLDTVSLAQNAGSKGGGLLVLSGNTDIIAHNLAIINNTAESGGGIYCEGAQNSLLLDADENGTAYGIISNTATTGSGGGAHISGECTFTSYVGAGDGWDFRGFLNNSANNNGGGIYAGSGAKVYLYGNRLCDGATCRGHNSTPVSLAGNTAKRGGALFATGPETTILGNNLKVTSNTAERGGAVYLMYQSEFVTQTTYNNGYLVHNGTSISIPNKTCWSKGKCNQFIGNTSNADPVNGTGGAFYVTNGSKLTAKRTHIEGNQATAGSVIHISDSGSSFDLEGSYVTGNGPTDASDPATIAINSESSSRMAYNTIADNYTGDAVIRNWGAHLNLYTSIVHNQTNSEILKDVSSASNDLDCLIVSKLGGITADRSIETAEPGFINRGNNNYHINSAISPAVDYCDNTHAPLISEDTDQQTRGWDDPDVSDTHGPYDVGADESHGEGDLVFADGFE